MSSSHSFPSCPLVSWDTHSTMRSGCPHSCWETSSSLLLAPPRLVGSSTVATCVPLRLVCSTVSSFYLRTSLRNLSFVCHWGFCPRLLFDFQLSLTFHELPVLSLDATPGVLVGLHGLVPPCPHDSQQTNPNPSKPVCGMGYIMLFPKYGSKPG